MKMNLIFFQATSFDDFDFFFYDLFLDLFLIHLIAHYSFTNRPPRCHLSLPKLPLYLPSPLLPQLKATLTVAPIATHHHPLKGVFSLSNKKEYRHLI
jgi:hypothetical protein